MTIGQIVVVFAAGFGLALCLWWAWWGRWCEKMARKDGLIQALRDDLDKAEARLRGESP